MTSVLVTLPSGNDLRYPGAEYQVEVFAPSSSTARRLVMSDRLAHL